MPTGLIIMHWDDRTGAKIIGAYPKNTKLDEKTLMQLYAQHEYTSEAGLVTLTSGIINLASYYTGPEKAIYVILLLSIEEEGEIYEYGLADVTQIIAPNIYSGNISDLLPSLFQRLNIYPHLNSEQKLAIIYANKLKRSILFRLQEEAVINKSEIHIWLRDKYKDGFFDIETELNVLVKEGIIKVASIRGQSSDLVFLTRDLAIIRLPPKDLFLDPVDHRLPKSLKKDYQKETRKFFKNYRWTKADSLQLANDIILDPEVYEVFKLLRKAIVTRNDIEKLRQKGVEDIEKVIFSLLQNEIIVKLTDSTGNEYFCLICDINLHTFYPEYLINSIKQQYQSKSQNSNVLIEALKILKDQYFIQRAPIPSKTEN